MAGRKAMPIELLLVKGKKNLTKQEIDARRKAENKIRPNADKVRPPAWLSPEAKREFKKLAVELQQTELITNVDVNQLAIYCRAYARYVELQNGTIEENEEGEEIRLYDEKQIDILFKQLKAMSAEFGFTPSSRAKIAIPKEPEKEKTPDEIMFGDV